MNNYEKLVQILAGMTFGELVNVSKELCNMASEKDNGYDLKDHGGWTLLLHDYAESNLPVKEN